ncbi:MAG: acetate uptake transporter [Helicobacteraceae bacterium]|nr:acetate uptake transporter [Helicobacteraceae bacterium]
MEKQELIVTNAVADPSALGLFGLAVVTIVASMQKLGVIAGIEAILAWAIFLGGFGQLIASILDFKKQNVYGATAFGAFGLFWLAVTFMWLCSSGALGEELAKIDKKGFGFVCIAYLIFCLIFTYAGIFLSKFMVIIFLLIDFLFIGLIGQYLFDLKAAGIFAGIFEFLISLVSFYGVAVFVINYSAKRQILTLGKPYKT